MSAYEILPPEERTPRIIMDEGKPLTVYPTFFILQRPKDQYGNERDQTTDVLHHLDRAKALNLPNLKKAPYPRMGRAVIVGGGPSLATQVHEIKALAADPLNHVFALNFGHNWLLDNGVVPNGCVLFEIDAEPDTLFARRHPDISYYICSHCHPKTFYQLEGCKRVLWHSDWERSFVEPVFGKDAPFVGGGIGTLLRTISIALYLGFKNIDLFGCESSFPDDAPSSHVDGYPVRSVTSKDDEPFFVWAEYADQPAKRFKTVSYLALQVREFEEYCQANHHHFALQVHGDGLLRYMHEKLYPSQYEIG